MFAAITNRITSWRRLVWSAEARRKLRHLVGLFLFEFVVVLLGVLAAQQLQVWVQDKEAHQRMLAEQARARVETARALQAARIWQVAGPCIDQRMVEMSDSIGRCDA